LNGDLFATGLAVVTPPTKDLIILLSDFLDLPFFIMTQFLPRLEDLPIPVEKVMMFNARNNQDIRLG
jgi:hypothetical protein